MCQERFDPASQRYRAPQRPTNSTQRVVSTADPEVLPRNLLKSLMSHTMFGGELQIDPDMHEDVLEDIVRSTRRMGQFQSFSTRDLSHTVPIHLVNRRLRDIEENQARRA